MPYKNPERKRQWEREHREQRNSRRRVQSSGRRSGQAEAQHSKHPTAATVRAIREPMPDLGSDQPTTGWKEILGRTVVIGLVLLAAFVGITMPIHGGQGSSK